MKLFSWFRKKDRSNNLYRDSDGRIKWKSNFDCDFPFAVTEETARQCVFFNACVAKISNQFASLRFHVYKKTDNGREKQSNHRLQRLFKQPSPFAHKFRFFQTMMSHALVTGNAYSFYDWGNNQLRILDPRQVRPKVVRLDNGEHDLIYEHTLPNERTLTLFPYEVLHISGPSFDGLVGDDPIFQNRKHLGHTIAAERLAAKYYKNGTHIDGYLKADGNVRPEDRKEMKESWMEEHNFDNAHSIALLYAGVDFVPMAIDAEKAQLLQSREWNAKQVASQIFSMPLWFAGLEPSTSTWEEKGTELVRTCLQPWIENWESEINSKLLLEVEKEDTYFEFSVDSLERGNIATRSNYYTAQRQNGTLTVNEIREKENLPSVGAAGDLITQPLNMGILLPTGQVVAPQPENAPTNNPNTLSKMSLIQEEAEKRVSRREDKAIHSSVKKYFGEQRDENGFKDWSKTFLGKHRKHLVEVFSPIFEGEELNNYIEKRLDEVRKAIALAFMES